MVRILREIWKQDACSQRQQLCIGRGHQQDAEPVYAAFLVHKGKIFVEKYGIWDARRKGDYGNAGGRGVGIRL